MDIVIQEILKARRAFAALLGQVQLDAIAHQDSVGPLLEELHESPGHWKGDNREDDGEEDRRLDLVLVRRDVGDEEVANDAADGDDEGCAEIDEELGGAVANEELGCTSQHQVERLSRRAAEIFASDCDHNVSIFRYEANQPLEAGYKTRSAFNHASHSSSFRYSQSLFFQLVLSVRIITLKYSSTILMNMMMAMRRDPKAIDPIW